MAIATESEWESDPELKAMRKEFVYSFAERRSAIEKALSALVAAQVSGKAVSEAVVTVECIAHKLAGAAESYGFPTLTLATAAFEDWVERMTVERVEAAEAAEYVKLLVDLLVAAETGAKDPAKLKDDPRLVQLLEAATRPVAR